MMNRLGTGWRVWAGWRTAGLAIALTLVVLQLTGGPPARGQDASPPAAVVTGGTPVASGSAAAAPAAEPAPSGPATCDLGIMIMNLSNADLIGNSFVADFWIWSVCDRADLHPLDTMDFINGSGVTSSLVSTQVRADGRVLSTAKITGTFREYWDETDFPFDHPRLDITFEDTSFTVDQWVYTADMENTGIADGVFLDEWSVTGFAYTPTFHTYESTFGVVTGETASTSTFSGLTLSIDLERRGPWTLYFKLTVLLYLCVILSVMSCFMHVQNGEISPDAMGLLVGALFAGAINMRSVASGTGRESAPTWLDGLHVVALIGLLFAAAIGMSIRTSVERGDESSILDRKARIAALGTGGIFLTGNILYFIFAGA